MRSTSAECNQIKSDYTVKITKYIHLKSYHHLKFESLFIVIQPWGIEECQQSLQDPFLSFWLIRCNNNKVHHRFLFHPVKYAAAVVDHAIHTTYCVMNHFVVCSYTRYLEFYHVWKIYCVYSLRNSAIHKVT